MSSPGLAGFERELRRLHDLAAVLVTPWTVTASASVTAGQERALLRLFGVGGVDAAGRPLAAEVIDRYLAGGAGRLAAGLVLPFAVALLEYDLAQPARRAAAEAEARRLVAAGLDRIDANRIARRELIDVLGEAGRPWIGTTLSEPVAGDAAAEAQAAIRAGADLLRVQVPSGRELTVRLGAVGVDVKRWQPSAGQGRPGATDEAADVAPAGSQRGLARLRSAIDDAAAERSGYVRLATSTPALSAPESAVAAAFERIDLVESDPIDEIVSTGVHPGRALADHAFARRLHRRAGAAILVGAGPLVVAPDLARGVPSEVGSRAGRALALQLLSALLAAAEGLPAEQVFLGAMPSWLLDDDEPFARAVAEVCLRRALLPANPLAFIEPVDGPRRGSWPYLLSALLPASPAGALVLRGPAGDAFGPVAAATRSATAVAAELGGSLDPGRLRGTALVHARATLAAAAEALEGLGANGWAAITGERMDGATEAVGWVGHGADSVTGRTDPFDPIGEALTGRPGGVSP